MRTIPDGISLVNDPSWSWTISMDAAQIAKTRRKQKAVCARYGRQSWTQWANLPVTELIEATAAIAALVEIENGMMEER